LELRHWLIVTFTSTDVTIKNKLKHPHSKQLILPRSNDGLWRVPLTSVSSFLKSSSSTCGLNHSSANDATILNNNYNNQNLVDNDTLLFRHNIIPNVNILSNCSNFITNSTASIQSHSARVKSLMPNESSVLHKVVRLHQRMGHPPAEAMCIAITGSSPMWSNSDLTPVQIRKIFNHYSCVACILAKRNHPGPQSNVIRNSALKPNLKSNVDKRVWLVGECITADILPRINPTSINGDTTIFIFEDVATGYIWAVPGKNDDSNAFIEALQIVHNFITLHGHTMRNLRTDGGGNLNSALVQQWLVKHRILSENSAPYQLFQNEVERHVQTTLKGVSTLLFSREFIRSDLWNYALIHYLITKNNTPNHKTAFSTPAYLFTNQTVNLHTTFLFAFGDIVIINVESKPEKNFKFDSKNQLGIYMSTSPGHKYAGMVYFPSEHQVLHRYTLAYLNISDLTFYTWYRKRYDLHGNHWSPYQTIANAFHDFTAVPLQYITNTSNNNTSHEKLHDSSLSSYSPALIPLSLIKQSPATNGNNNNKVHPPFALSKPLSWPHDEETTMNNHSPLSSTSAHDLDTTMNNNNGLTQATYNVGGAVIRRTLVWDNSYNSNLPTTQPISHHMSKTLSTNPTEEQLAGHYSSTNNSPSDSVSQPHILPSQQLDGSNNRRTLRHSIDWESWSKQNPSIFRTRSSVKNSSLLLSSITSTSYDDNYIHVFLPAKQYSSESSAANVIHVFSSSTINPNEQHVVLDEPTIAQALNSANKDEWIKAIRKEVNDILRNEFLTPLPSDFKLTAVPKYRFVRTTTKLKLKYKPTGELDKYKGRTCVRGDLIPNNDPTLNYSPTITFIIFMFILQIAVNCGMLRDNFDTVSAFLRTKFLPTDIPTYTKLEPKIAELCNLDPNTIYLMNSHFYGLPDASRAYYAAYKDLLVNNGYKQSHVDPCLFYRVTSTETTYIPIYVDDTYVFSTTQAGLDRVKRVVQTKYPIEDRKISEFLGIEISVLPNGTDLLLRQPKLLQDLFQEFPCRTSKLSKKIATPQNHAFLHNYRRKNNIQHNNIDKESPTITPKQFRHLLGILINLVKTRIDISMAVSMCSTNQNKPTVSDYEELLQIVDYLHSTKHQGLIIQKHSSIPFQLYCHVDASYMLHPDARSHSGYSLSFSPSGPVFFCKSKKQVLIATSAMHAETRALYQLTLQILQIHLVAIEIQLPLQLPTIIFEDNAPLIYTTSDPIARTIRCKHFLMLINFIKEQVTNNLIKLIKIPSEDNPADSLAKPTFGKDFFIKSNHLMFGKALSTSR